MLWNRRGTTDQQPYGTLKDGGDGLGKRRSPCWWRKGGCGQCKMGSSREKSMWNLLESRK